MRKPIAAIVIVLALIGLISSAGVVRAELTATGVVWAWDIAQNKYQNSNVIINWYDGSWVPFWHAMTFDAFPWLGDPNPCTPGTTTWAGLMYYGVYHEDNAPAGAPGFRQTRNWSLVDCSRDGDQDFDNADLARTPPDYRLILAECRYSLDPLHDPHCTLVTEDVVTPCTTGNCATEIITTFMINLDTDCDGNLDAGYDIWSGNALRVCFFAEAQVPTWPTGGPMWGGPLQGRISTVGGDKTVNFSPQPLSVELAAFTAKPQARSILVEWQTISEVDNVGFNLYRADSLDGRQIRLNAGLIPSKGPGSPIGFAYSFVDRTARAGQTYYYWLEDLSVYGWYTKHGPMSAAIPPSLSVPRWTP
jgi:hypothetical protein